MSKSKQHADVKSDLLARRIQRRRVLERARQATVGSCFVSGGSP